MTSDMSIAARRTRSPSTVLAALAHFAGQALGIALALLVSLMIAGRLGVGHETDAFFLARRVVTAIIEALNQLLVVFYIPLIAADATLRSGTFRRIFARRAVVSCLGGTLLGAALIIAAPMIVSSLAPTFVGEARALSTRVLAIFGAALPATTVCMMFAAFLNVTGQFGAPSALRQLPRALIVATLLVAQGALAVKAALAFTVGWYLVMLAMLALAVPVFRAHADDDGAKPVDTGGAAPSPKAHGLALMLLMLGTLAGTWIETAYAAGVGPGGVTTLELGQRLGAFLANTLAMALTLAVYARWSRAESTGRMRSDPSQLGRTLVVGLCVLVPIQVFFLVNSDALVMALFGHGRFTGETAEAVASAIRWMTLAPLTAFVLRLFVVRILVEPGAQAVFWVSLGVLVDLAGRVVVFSWLTPILGVAGIMIGQSVGPLIAITVYLVMARRRPGFVGGFALGRSRGLPATALLGCLGLAAGAAIGPALAQGFGLSGVPAAFCTLALSGVIGVVAFAAAGRALRVPLSID